MRAFATLSLLFSSSALAFFHIFSGFSAMGCGASARVSDETAALPAAQTTPRCTQLAWCKATLDMDLK
jgi:hypothetical protein